MMRQYIDNISEIKSLLLLQYWFNYRRIIDVVHYLPTIHTKCAIAAQGNMMITRMRKMYEIRSKERIVHSWITTDSASEKSKDVEISCGSRIEL